MVKKHSTVTQKKLLKEKCKIFYAGLPTKNENTSYLGS
jgi:hypothetical protein